MLHPRGDCELIRQVLWYHLVRNLCCLPPVKTEDEVAVPPTVCHKGRSPIGGDAGSREKVCAARRGPWVIVAVGTDKEAQQHRTVNTNQHRYTDGSD